MKGIKKILIFSLLMFIPNMVKADCDYNEKSRLQSLASNLNFSYDYKEIADGKFNKVSFDIIINNLQPELYIDDVTNGVTHYYNNKNEITINNYSAGSTIEFEIRARLGNCKNQYLITHYVTLPPYNKYYKDLICNGVTSYKLCDRWSKITLSYDDFVERVTEYKKELRQTHEDPIIEDENEFIEKIISFLSKYSIYLFGGIIIVCSSLIFYLSRKDDFDLK